MQLEPSPRSNSPVDASPGWERPAWIPNPRRAFLRPDGRTGDAWEPPNAELHRLAKFRRWRCDLHHTICDITTSAQTAWWDGRTLMKAARGLPRAVRLHCDC